MFFLPFCLPNSSATFCSSQEDKSSGSSPLGQSCSKSLRFASRSSFCFCRNVFVSIFQIKYLISQCASPLCLALYIAHKIASSDRNVSASVRCFFCHPLAQPSPRVQSFAAFCIMMNPDRYYL